jgi:methyl-accepting chemotaxis protein
MIVEIHSALDSINAAVSDITQTVTNQGLAADLVANQIDSIARLCDENAQDADASWQLANQTEASSKRLAQAASLFRV